MKPPLGPAYRHLLFVRGSNWKLFLPEWQPRRVSHCAPPPSLPASEAKPDAMLPINGSEWEGGGFQKMTLEN